MLFNCAVCSGFIMSGVFTQVQNVAMEEGLTVWEAGTLIMFSSIPEVLDLNKISDLIGSCLQKSSKFNFQDFFPTTLGLSHETYECGNSANYLVCDFCCFSIFAFDRHLVLDVYRWNDVFFPRPSGVFRFGFEVLGDFSYLIIYLLQYKL